MSTNFSHSKIRYLSASILAASMFFVVALPAFAATSASLTPSTSMLTVGQQFTLAITVDPKGATDYGEKIQIDYPADALSVVSFSYANPWMPFSLSGYDDTDDAQGTLIKTADYPGGFSSQQTFGTVTFLAKKAVNGTVKISGSSISFETSTEASIGGTNSAFFISPALPAAPTVGTANASTSSALNTNEQGAAAVSTGVLKDPKELILIGIIILALIAAFLTLPWRILMQALGFKKK